MSAATNAATRKRCIGRLYRRVLGRPAVSSRVASRPTRVALATRAREIPMATERFDAIIIGTGQSGMPRAGALGAAGWKTAVVERQYVGGTCINVGCTPTKTMVASARVAYLA